VVSTIKIFVPSAEAKPGPPLAPILGQHQVNLIEFCKEFNKLSLAWTNGVPLAVKVIKKESNKFNILIRAPINKFFLEQILIDSKKNQLECTKLYDIIVFRSAIENKPLKDIAKMFFGFLKSKQTLSISL
jgi:ribosomal protein L11